ncbi:tripartite tricarboxylate transporter permease [Paracoccus sp. P2]|uniref:TctA family transporter n=1 Tax=Paracoccus pantotrophus TaxID=82367 RepID=A0A1I5DBW1_PARPN|nr:tripartite tricarboxylate transporter permease [Paracoccus pantotrophus]MDF3854004.1 tripartite tricarboxylate transporter permease [Paracoccus pantotrophus]QFG35102.1 tripartite tricarboxylate transporter permease [Paracoccus pantotrophus]QLH13343.1 tripartite tricarboxylate transporter permease [Paracoccus pantotrophus]RDD99237.1 tripartite tricarboxylate transporter permease [Paracoccus pantotrophus]RKS44717.1 TctA family transporter [Paracoccus pantotrophus]
MELFSNLALGFSVASSLANLAFCLIGVMLGTLIGVLPGIGATATIAMLLPITFQLEPVSSLIMLAGIYYGAQYGGSTTAILINMPGESSSAVTAIDGYQMARRGKAGTALALAALGSFFAGSVSTFLVALFAPPLTAVALKFGAAEYFSLMVLGLVMSVALAHGSVLKALAMVVLGLLLGMVGTDIYTGAPRFTMGITQFADGLNFVAVAVGVFGIAEILRNLEDEHDRQVMTKNINRLFPTGQELRQMIGPVLRGTGIGSVLGILPGGGAILASFASYTIEKKVSRHPEEFGKGALAGVAGPESANNAGAQTSFIPLLTLGIPANPVMALMIGAMIIQGIVPGPNVVSEQPALFWGIIASMWIGNLMLVVLNLPLIGLWVKLLTVPYYVLFPIIMAMCSIGVYSVNSNSYDLFAVAFFGLLGYVMSKLRCEPAPLLLGFVLGPLLEENLRRAMILSRGDPTTFLTRPISATLLAMSLVVLVLVFMPQIRKRRDEVFTESDA